MGFMDKLKGLFKKKDAGAKQASAVKKPKVAAKSRADQFSGSGKVPDALKFAAEKIDAKVAAGKITDKRGDMFFAQLKAVEASDAAEDAKLIQISQIIGEIVNA